MKKISLILFSILLFPLISFSENTQSHLPPELVKQFVQSIAVIKHYYIKPTTDKQLFSNAIRGMVSDLDPHSSYLDENDLKELQAAVSGKFVGIGIELTTESGMLKVISPLQDSPAEHAGIKPNDFIIKINGQLVQNMTLHEAVNKIKGERDTKVALTLLRKNEKKPIDLTVTRDVIKLITVKSKMLEHGFGYIRITFFQGPVDAALKKDIQQLLTESGGKLRGLILDLRNNPGGLLDVSAKVADTFLDPKDLHKFNGVIVYTEGRTKASNVKIKASAGDKIPHIPMVVMINGGSASASEIVAGALQDYKRAVVVGTRSFGKGSVQTVLPIGDNDAIKLTTALYYTPAGRSIQAEGILPDVTIPELTVSEKDIKGLLDIDENGYRNHLANKNKTNPSKLDELKKVRKKELDLAKEDYQLYQALMILKGMYAAED